MRNTKSVWLFIFLLLVGSSFNFLITGAIPVSKLGKHPLCEECKPSITAIDVVKILNGTCKIRLEQGFKKAGYEVLFTPFINRLTTQELKETDWKEGVENKLKWMLYYYKNDVRVIKEPYWAGKGVVPVFSLSFCVGDKRYHFYIPKKCCNVALVRIDKCQCEIKRTPSEIKVGDTVTFIVDVTGIKPGEITEANFIVNNKDTGEMIKKLGLAELKEKNWSVEVPFDKKGSYEAIAQIKDKYGKPSISCENNFRVNKSPIPKYQCKIDVFPKKRCIGEELKITALGITGASSISIKISKQEGHKEILNFELKRGESQEKSFEEAGVYNVVGTVNGVTCSEKFEIVEYVPQCRIKKPSEIKVGDKVTFTVDVTGIKPGEITEANFIVKDQNSGKIIENLGLPALKRSNSGSLTVTFDKKGSYEAIAQIKDKCGKLTPCKDNFKVRDKSGDFYYIIEFGFGLARGTYSGYLFPRFGLGYELIKNKLKLTLSGSSAITLASKPFKTAVMGDVLLNFYSRKLYLAAGLGLSTEVREKTLTELKWNSDVDIVTRIGFNFLKKKKHFIFTEFRLPVGEMIKLSKHHMIMVGYKWINCLSGKK